MPTELLRHRLTEPGPKAEGESQGHMLERNTKPTAGTETEVLTDTCLLQPGMGTKARGTGAWSVAGSTPASWDK